MSLSRSRFNYSLTVTVVLAMLLYPLTVPAQVSAAVHTGSSNEQAYQHVRAGTQSAGELAFSTTQDQDSTQPLDVQTRPQSAAAPSSSTVLAPQATLSWPDYPAGETVYEPRNITVYRLGPEALEYDNPDGARRAADGSQMEWSYDSPGTPAEVMALVGDLGGIARGGTVRVHFGNSSGAPPQTVHVGWGTSPDPEDATWAGGYFHDNPATGTFTFERDVVPSGVSYRYVFAKFGSRYGTTYYVDALFSYDVDDFQPFSSADSTLSRDECPICYSGDVNNTAGGPINTLTGNYNYQVTDISIPTLGEPLHFERTYNSLPITGSVVYSRPLG